MILKMEVFNKEDLPKYTKGYTHSGVFHADDVFASALLKMLYGNEFDIERVSKVPEDVGEDVIVFDIGLGEFDHHQIDAPVRPNGVKYAAFGLLWRRFGKYLVLRDETIELFDRTFVQTIDAIDNGQVAPTITDDISAFTMSSLVSAFNPVSLVDGFPNIEFGHAVKMAKQILLIVLNNVITKIEYGYVVDAIVEQTKNGILVLDQAMPWQESVFSHPNRKTILYVVYPSTRRDWKVQCVPDKPGSFGTRKSLPKEWWGLNDKELQKVCDVNDAIFTHKVGFIGGAATKEGAIEMAEKAIEY